MNRNRIEKALKNPVSWFVGSVASVVGVSAAVLSDPTGGVAALLTVFIEQASSIFTAASIAGFTLAPEIPQIPSGAIQAVALVSGGVVVLTIGSKVWDRLKRRFTE